MITTSYTYDAAYRLLTRTVTSGSAFAPQMSQPRLLRPANVKPAFDPAPSALLHPNSALSLLTAQSLSPAEQSLPQSYSESFGYDALGHLASKNGQTLNYADANHIHAATSFAGNRYSYDANGNQITCQTALGNDTLSYDVENRLTKVVRDNVVIAEYTYDANGVRVKAVENGKNHAVHWQF